jgi:nitroreductase
MELQQSIINRRSIKSFDPKHTMPEAEIEKLLRLAILSPTAFNIQHWRFVIVDDIDLRNKIKDESWGQDQVTDASLFIVLAGDLMAWNKSTSRYWRNAPKDIQDFMVPTICDYYDKKPEVQRDEVMRSCSMAAMNLMLTAKDLGYDSCPMDGFNFEKVAKLLNFPSDHIPVMFVAIGKPLNDPRPRSGQLSIKQVVQYNQF